MLQSNISAISSNIHYELEQQASIVSDSGWDTKDIDFDNKTVVFDCYVIPKSYNPQHTTATILCNGEEVPMTLENGKYTAKITLSMFEDINIDGVNFIDNGIVNTQKLNWHINPKYDLIPTAYIYYSGSWSQDYGETITRKYSGYIDIDFEHKTFSEGIKELKVYMLIDGKEVWSDNPKIETLYNDGYIQSCRADIQQNFELKRGSTILMYAEATDYNGWVYRTILEDATIGEKGNSIPNNDIQQSEADIYDAEGNLLYKADRY